MSRHVYAPKKTIRDFSKKRFGGNPLFPRDGSTHGSSAAKAVVKGPWAAILGFAVLVGAGLFGIGYGVWGAPLKLTDISIEGATPSTERRIRNIIDGQHQSRFLGFLPQSNTLLFRTGALDETLRGAFFFDELMIRKKLPHSLVVSVVERDAEAAFITDTKLFAIDNECTIIRELTTEEVAELPFLPTGVQSVTIPVAGDDPGAASVSADEAAGAPTADAVQAPGSAQPAPLAPLPRNTMPVLTHAVPSTTPNPGTKVCEESTLTFIKEAYANLSETAKSEPQWFIPDDEAQSIDVMMQGDWHVFLSSSLPFAPQAERLSVVLREKIGKDRDRIKYVDLRYNETVFFRLK